MPKSEGSLRLVPICVAITTVIVLVILYFFACERKASPQSISGAMPDTVHAEKGMANVGFLTGKPSPNPLPNLGIYHGSDPNQGVSTGTDVTVYKLNNDNKFHIEANCSVQNTGDATFWIADTDTYRQYHFLTVASYNISTGFMGEYYKDEYDPRSYCVSDLPCGICSPSPGDHFNYICPGQVDTYYDEYPADTLGDYAFKITVNELGRVQESDQPDKDNVFVFGGHVVVDTSAFGCDGGGICYKFVRDDNVVTPKVRNKLLNMK